MKYKLILLIVTVFLFIIPFFWLKPGWMDLGGDGSRLYFYDPLNYLKNFPLWGVTPDGLGGPNISYHLIPYVSLFFVLKQIFQSSYLVITIFNDWKLIVSFLSVYLIILEFLKDSKDSHENLWKYLVSSIAGLFYVFSPFVIGNGWDKAMPIQDQIFINPLIFFLLLKYINTQKIKYLLTMLLTTVIFAPSFSPGPKFFAFFPLAVLYLWLYAVKIKKTTLEYKKIIFIAFLFFLIHSFHLAPQIISFFSDSGNVYNQAVFSKAGQIIRGLSYFTSSAQNVELTKILLTLPSSNLLIIKIITPFWFVFLAIIISGLTINRFFRKKDQIFNLNFFLLFWVFLITLFLTTANITHLGLAFYKSLFIIPGFSMFRNYVGQFSLVFVFFYSLVLGLALFNVCLFLKEKQKIVLLIALICLLIVSSISFIKGDTINLVLNSGEKTPVRVPIKMDPVYEQVLAYIRQDPIDGKYLTLPLTEAGLQMLAGKDGGAYQGPSTISYLTGKKDFSGYQVLGSFSEDFLRLVRERDYTRLNTLLSALNIKYIFYNSDPYIYEDNFSNFPYSHVKDFMPKNQTLYKEFIEKLAVEKVKDFGDKYHFYKIKDDLFSPHIFTTNQITYSNQPFTLFLDHDLGMTTRQAIFDINDSQDSKNNIVLEAENKSPLLPIRNNYHLHYHEPFISLGVNDLRYPLALLRERFELWKVSNDHGQFLDFNLFYLSKRIFELNQFGEKMPILKTQVKKPEIWEFYKTNRYNSWEVSLVRYEKRMQILIQWVDDSKLTASKLMTDKIKINEQLLQHQMKLINIINSINKTDEEKKYLLFLTHDMFSRLFEKLNLKMYDSSALTYTLQVPENYFGEYEVFLDKKDIKSGNSLQALIEINGQTFQPLVNNSDSDRLQFQNIIIQDKKETAFTFHLPSENLIKDILWENSGRQEDATGSATIEINNLSGNNSGGVVKKIEGWLPNQQYVISFDYLTFGNDFNLRIFDRQIRGEKKIETVGTTYLVRNLNSGQWKTHQIILTSDPNSVSAFIQITGNNEKIKSSLKIKNLSVNQIIDPKIFFKKVQPQTINEKKLPQIVFEKINPTKYSIQVKNAHDSYVLVFLDGFSSKWKLFLSDTATQMALDSSYFNGDVNEGKHKNIFLDVKTFETWGKKPIGEKQHFSVNGYANGWQIESSDVQDKSDYTLILEMTAQKYFYVFFFLSIITVLGVCLWLLKELILLL